MAQVPKDSMRSAIVAAAADELADVGFERATLSAIARRAGTSTGNVYKYFADKAAVFEAAIPDTLVRQLNALLRGRVTTLGSVRDARALTVDHPHRVAGEALVTFGIAHRAQLRFLIRRAQGTRHEGFAEDFVAHVTRLALVYARKAYPKSALTAAHRRALARIYRGLLDSVASMLETETSDAALREAHLLFMQYHLAGLKALFESARSSR